MLIWIIFKYYNTLQQNIFHKKKTMTSLNVLVKIIIKFNYRYYYFGLTMLVKICRIYLHLHKTFEINYFYRQKNVIS